MTKENRIRKGKGANKRQEINAKEMKKAKILEAWRWNIAIEQFLVLGRAHTDWKQSSANVRWEITPDVASVFLKIYPTEIVYKIPQKEQTITTKENRTKYFSTFLKREKFREVWWIQQMEILLLRM